MAGYFLGEVLIINEFVLLSLTIDNSTSSSMLLGKPLIPPETLIFLLLATCFDLVFVVEDFSAVDGCFFNNLLFLAVFNLALGRSVQTINGVAFANFIAPGLIMMTILQNAFANSAPHC